jgi:hypothetical protein
MIETLLTYKEGTIKRLIERNLLPVVKVSTRKRGIRPADLQAHIMRHRPELVPITTPDLNPYLAGWKAVQQGLVDGTFGTAGFEFGPPAMPRRKRR